MSNSPFNIERCDQVPATIELDNVPVAIQDIIEGKTGAVLTSPGLMFIDSDFIDLSRNPDALATEFSGDEPLVTLFSPRAPIVVSGHFRATNAMNLTLISPHGVFVSNAEFENFAKVELRAEGGAVVLRETTANQFTISANAALVGENVMVNQLQVNSSVLGQYYNLIVTNINIAISNAAYLCGNIEAADDIIIDLGGAKLSTATNTKIEAQGDLHLINLAEHTNTATLKGKNSLSLSSSRGITNNKEMITAGALTIKGWSFANGGYVESGDIAKFYVATHFSNQITGFISTNGITIRKEDASKIELFTNLGIIEIGIIDSAISALTGEFKYSNGLNERIHTKTRNGHCGEWGTVDCNIYEERFKEVPLGSRMEGQGNLFFDISNFVQDYSKVYSTQKITFINSNIQQHSISLYRDGRCSVRPYNRGCEPHSSFNILSAEVGHPNEIFHTGPNIWGARTAKAIYKTYNPVLHAAGGFEGSLTGLTISSTGSNVPALEYSTNNALTQTGGNALTRFVPNANFATLSGLQVTMDSQGQILVTANNGMLLSDGFVPSDLGYVFLQQMQQSGHIMFNPHGPSPIFTFAHTNSYQYEEQQTQMALVTADYSNDENVRFFGDYYVFDQLFKNAIFLALGSIRGIDNTQLFSILAAACNEARANFGFSFGAEPTAEQLRLSWGPMACPVKTTNCYSDDIKECYTYKIFYNDAALNRFINDSGASMLTEKAMNLAIDGNVMLDAMAKIVVGKDITLTIAGNAITLGMLEGNNINIKTSGNFINAGQISSVEDLAISALNIAILNELRSGKDINVSAIEKLVMETLVAVERYANHNTIQVKSRTVTNAAVKAGGVVNFSAGSDVELIGAKVEGGRVFIKSGNNIIVVPAQLYNQLTDWGKKHFYEFKSLQNIVSTITATAGEIDLEAQNNIGTIGAQVTAAGNVTANAKNGSITTAPAVNQGSLQQSYTSKKLLSSTTRSKFEEWTNLIPSVFTSLAGAIGFSSAQDTNLIAAKFSAKKVSMQVLDAGAIINLLGYKTYVIKGENTFTRRFELSFSGGKMNYAMIKSSTNARYDETVHPTIIQAGDYFLGYAADGSWYQLASVVEGKTVTLIAPRGVTLAASPEFHTSLNVVNEKGIGIGLQCDKEAIAIKASAQVSSAYTASEDVLARTSSVISEYFNVYTEGTYRTEGATITADKELNVKAKVEVHDVVYDTHTHQTRKMNLEFGGKIGFDVSAIGRLFSAGQELAQSKVDSTEDKINTVFALYNAYHAFNRAALFLATPGLGLGSWLYMKYQKSTDTIEVVTAKPTEILAGTYHSVTEELKFVATQVLAMEAYFNTDKFTAESAKSTLLRKSQYWGGEGTIPIGGAAVAGASGFYGQLKEHEEVHFHASLKFGKLEMTVRGHANIRGAHINAEDLHALFGSLTLESVQNAKKRDGFSVGAGVGSEGFNSASAGFDYGRRNVVDEVTSLVGAKNAVIVVAELMEMIGSMVANAERNPDGSFTDAGKLQLTVGELLTRDIFNSDDGKTLQAAMSLMTSSSEAKAEGENNPYLSEYHATVAAHYGEGYTRATIGKGTVTLGKGKLPDDLNRDINNVQDFHWDYKLDPIKMHYYNVDQDKLDKLHQSMASGEWGRQVQQNFETMPYLIKEFAKSGFTLSQEDLVKLQSEYWAPDYISYAEHFREGDEAQKLLSGSKAREEKENRKSRFRQGVTEWEQREQCRIPQTEPKDFTLDPLEYIKYDIMNRPYYVMSKSHDKTDNVYHNDFIEGAIAAILTTVDQGTKEIFEWGIGGQNIWYRYYTLKTWGITTAIDYNLNLKEQQEICPACDIRVNHIVAGVQTAIGDGLVGMGAKVGSVGGPIGSVAGAVLASTVYSIHGEKQVGEIARPIAQYIVKFYDENKK